MASSPHFNLDDLNQLRELLVEHFDVSELRALCFELGIKYEHLKGGALPDKVQELIGYCQRRDLLAKLTQQCQQFRPHINWPHSQPVITSPDEQLQEKAGTGLHLLAQRMKDAEVRNAVSDYKSDFKEALSGIETVRHYKKLHDLFQDMEMGYNLILHNDRQRMDEDETAWASLVNNQTLLQGPIYELLKMADTPRFATRDSYWLPILRRGQTAMRSAIEEHDLGELDTALRFLYRALDRGLPRVNGHLVDAASDLPLDRLAVAMQSIHQRLETSLPSETVVRIATSVAALEKLNDDLNDLIADHNNWQRLDDELRRVDVFLGNDPNDITELELTHPDFQAMAADLYSNSDRKWALDLQRSSARLQEALASGSNMPPATVIGIFQTYRVQVGRRFRFVDDQLLQLCENLRQIGEPLDWLLRTI